MDGIVFSYALTMFNPGWELAIDAAARDLSDEGLIAVVDFHDTPCAWFGRWMGINHVRMEGHLLPRLRERFEPVYEEERRAFGGLWRYFLFIGRRSVRGGV
jgi:S-adenosylmethionine-diacylgycerolhomoserine-N-methlytransferase